jgi:hypothetical protein
MMVVIADEQVVLGPGRDEGNRGVLRGSELAVGKVLEGASVKSLQSA